VIRHISAFSLLARRLAARQQRLRPFPALVSPGKIARQKNPGQDIVR